MNTYGLSTALAGALVLCVPFAGTALADNFTLRVGAGHPSAPTIYVNLIEQFFVPEVRRRVAEETEHEVTFIEGYGGALVGVSDTLEAVESGLLDIGGYCVCLEPSKLYLHNFPYYAPFGPTDGEAAIAAARATYDAVPWLQEAFDRDYGQVLLGLSGFDNYHIGTVEPWDTLADLKGVKISGAGPNLPWLQYAQAVPIQSALTDAYMSMQTGVYDGWLVFPSAYLAYRLYEPAPYYTLVDFGAMATAVLTMNARSLARLPEDVQAIIREVGREYEQRSGVIMNERQAAALAGLEAAGATVRTLPEQTRIDWANALADLPRQSATDANGRGMPGTEVLQTYIAQAAEGGHHWIVDYSLD
ncbi:C4-dicarboxylate TRAP transporter substrate-binding protein [Ruixingdingia sedimenti]|uniref:C4-dicarboxylate TRAP transporter substrate-binding protein n=1 Tax=Ruixingdingia sedimenti TaxID=3073604 RepID=A0ABU1FE75_9RHOB|nr:C4-dicarboxylate TRAP transporter substrate-binding protein [Xinfangfangia sp. LG-4]MDR5654677.1 C4-dicarboxylate TRAP transporter substrate-binding protein [Xinfangfangia sp. LG-4]